MPSVAVNGITLAYRTLGAEAAPPLVLLHGRTANRHDWNGVIRRFAAVYRVYAPDLRGHGESAWPGSYDLPEMAEDVRAFLDELGADRATVVGHSLGGMVAYHLASAHPGRVARLVLEEAPPPLPLERPDSGQDGAARGFDLRMIAQTERQFAAPDPAWAAALGRITAPTLVVSGGAAGGLPVWRTAELIPGAELVTVEAGHLVHVTRAAEFLSVVGDFLGVEL